MSIVAVVDDGVDGCEVGELGFDDPPPHAAASRHKADMTPRTVTRMLSPFASGRVRGPDEQRLPSTSARRVPPEDSVYTPTSASRTHNYLERIQSRGSDGTQVLEHGVGFHPVASGNFLKSVVVM